VYTAQLTQIHRQWQDWHRYLQMGLLMEQFLEFAVNHWVLTTLFLVLLAGLILTESKRGGEAVEINEATRLINREGAAILDLRSEAEYKAGHIVGALNIPFTRLKDNLQDLEKYKSNPIILVCKMGQHSGSAGKLLRQAGFEVRRLSGGMSQWESANLPLER